MEEDIIGDKNKNIKVFLSDHCNSCKEVKELLETGSYTIDGEPVEKPDVNIIDITTPDGIQDVLENDVSAVPSIYKDGNICSIKIDTTTNKLVIDCNQEKSTNEMNINEMNTNETDESQ